MIRKFRWFWAWQDRQEEAWLEQMSGQGLHLKAVLPFGIYQFEPGLPQGNRYSLDFLTSGKDRAEHLQRFQEAGWEMIAEIGAWQYFRKPARPGEEAGLYPDNQSKIQKFRRLLVFLVVFLPILIALLNGGFGSPTLSLVLQLIGILMMALYILTIVKVMQRIRQLERG